MASWALMCGTGFTLLDDIRDIEAHWIDTPYGRPSSPIYSGQLGPHRLHWLLRHGDKHQYPPHKINYRANIWALQAYGISQIMSIAAVGSMDHRAPPAALVMPDQLIDTTRSRISTFFDGENGSVQHVDFTEPYAMDWRQLWLDCAQTHGISCVQGGCYAVTEGPRLETAAEIRYLAQMGATLVGMTGMPEAVLARELGLDYACCSVVANWGAAWTGDAAISMDEIKKYLKLGMSQVHQWVRAFAQMQVAVDHL